MSAGGWNCFITNLVKSPYDVGAYKSMSREEQDRAIARWAPVLEHEVSVGKPRVLVPMGTEVADALRRFLSLSSARVLVYPGKLWHYATFNYGPVTAEMRRTYEEQFASLRAYLTSVAKRD